MSVGSDWMIRVEERAREAAREKFLESPETLRAIFVCRNSLCISRKQKI